MNNPSSVANIHAMLGNNVVLFACDGKKPSRNGWRTLTVAKMTPRHLAWLANRNIGLATGEPSEGCCALDIDTDDGLKNFLALVPAAQTWPRLVGARGAKLLVRIEGVYPKKCSLTLEGVKWGDWVATGALAIVFGIHPDTKKPYEWTVQTAVPTIAFSVIEAALTTLHVRQGSAKAERETPSVIPTTTNNSSEYCILNPASCTLDSALYTLHNNGEAHKIVAKIEGDRKMRVLVEERFKPLEKLYSSYIEAKFSAAAGHRNGFLVEAIPFLIRCVSPTLALELAMMFYHTHQALFKDPPEQHKAEAEAMIRGVEKTYLGQLQKGEHSVFEALDETGKSAFRICRDLAHRPDCQTPLVFFMACNELGSRLLLSDMQAFRLLRWFEDLGIIATDKKGEPRQPGKRPRASSFRWLLGTSLANTQTEGENTK